MRRLKGLIAGALMAMPAAAAAQYETPANPPDPGEQLAEMLTIYDEACLHAFPNDDAVAQSMAARGAAALSREQVQAYLHDDPGRGWRVTGRTTWFDVTIEEPPYHACGVRTLTVAGFPNLQPYRDVADRFEAGHGFQRFDPVTMQMGNVQTTGGGEQRTTRNGGESLLVFLTTPSEGNRGNGQTAIEVRFVHQFSQQ